MEKYEELIYNKISGNKSLLITAPTGTGKSTYIPVLLNKRFADCTVALIQPRRLAVLNIYSFLKDKIHHLNYKIRHSFREHKNGKITIMTDGMFIKDVINGKTYDIVIVDEVHERSIRIEFVLMWLRKVKINKVIFMSATVEDTDIERYFKCERLDLNVKGFSAKVFYESEAVSDYLISAYYKIKSILMGKYKNEEEKSKKNGSIIKKEVKDVLVFLPGEEDILELKKMLKRLGLDAITVYGNVNYDFITKKKDIKDSEEREVREKIPFCKKMYASSSGESPRRVILATNIAETSITIPNVKYVIDSGVQKTKIFKDVNFMGIQKISKESADQRKGRCNRITDGICFRLYTKEEYDNFEKMVPEIAKCDISDFILWMCVMKMDFLKWKFLVYPRRESVKRAMEFLIGIGAICISENEGNERESDDEENIRNVSMGSLINKCDQKNRKNNLKKEMENKNVIIQISRYGRKLLEYPLDAKLSNFFRISNDLSCGRCCAKIISLINEENFNFLVNSKKRDILSLLDLMDAFLQEESDGIENQYCDFKNKLDPFGNNLIEDKVKIFDHFKFCQDNQINMKALKRCVLTNKQLQRRAKGSLSQNIEKAFSESFKHNLSVLQKDGSYKMKSGLCVFIHPNSYFFNKRAKRIVFFDVLCTSKFYVKIVGRYID